VEARLTAGGFRRVSSAWWAYIVPTAVLLVLWEGSTEWWGWAKRAFFSSPSQVLDRTLDWWLTGKIFQPVALTLGETLAGLVIGLLLGAVLGVLAGWYAWFDDLSDASFTFLYSVPFVVFAVVLRYVVGSTPAVPVIIATLACLWPTVFTVTAGMRSISPQLIRMARMFGATDQQLFRTVALPSTVPYLTSVLRVAIGRALGGAIVGEYLASNAGAGYVMFNAASSFGMADALVFVIVIMAISLVMQEGIGIVERRVNAWRTL
jgi:ABC-type nitrate/sulfonate/bicarbonate transport system permease component